MSNDLIAYSVNVTIGGVLSVVMSRHWPRAGALRTWIVAAWVLTAADLCFVLRAIVPNPVTRLAPTLMVTAGQLVLVLAAERTTGRPTTLRVAAAILVLHFLFLLVVAMVPELAAWRSVGNAILWSALAFGAAWILSRRTGSQRSYTLIPALVLVVHGVFHLLRLALAARASARPGAMSTSLVQLIGDLEVSLFMVALFVSVLVAFLEQSIQELRDASAHVRELSSMLPLCAWCRNVRNDDGYWTGIETYLATHSVSVTHGICESCAATHFAAPDVPAGT